MADSNESADSPAARRHRKDRVIQTRVPRDLEVTLKEEARRQRLSVSHLIRNVLEDTFQFVDGVVADVDQIVSDSVTLAKTVRDGARRLTGAATGRDSAATRTETDADAKDDISHIYAWNEVVLHRPAHCSSCSAEIARGQRGFAGLSDAPGARRAWLCERCVESL